MSAATTDLAVEIVAGQRKLVVTSDDPAALDHFDGTSTSIGRTLRLTGPLSARNAAGCRAIRQSLLPKPIGLRTSAGTGDRLGLATAGHVKAFQSFGRGVRPVFAQQSIREMDRLGRSPQQVLDDATFGCVEAGWYGSVGADADHLKSTDDIDRCLAAGFSMFTIDVGDHVGTPPETPTDKHLAGLPWHALEDDQSSAWHRYAGTDIDVGDRSIPITDGELAHAMLKYGPAVATGAAMYRHLAASARSEFEVEIAVDETDEVTTPLEHFYIASELQRLGVRWISFAPRHLGVFEKGVEFVGDPEALFVSIRTHASIARSLGPYKIGMHSGSDKYSIYEGLVAATDGMVHLKTSGTSYLVALDVAAHHEPALLRQIYSVSHRAYTEARASYQVSADESAIPSPANVRDADAASLLGSRATRQVLHVGYGAVLREPDGRASALDAVLRGLLARHREAYGIALEGHLGRHLSPLSRGRRPVRHEAHP